MAFNIKTPFVVSTHVKKFAGTTNITNKSKAAGLGVNTSASSVLTYNQAGTLRKVVSEDGTQTLTNKTITGAAISGGINSDYKSLVVSQTAQDNIVPATLTGFSWTLVAGATYVFDVELATTMSTNGGLELTFLLTTATLTSIRYNHYITTAADNGTAVSGTGTTATSGTKVVDTKTAAYTRCHVFGTLVVNAGGTLAWQFCQESTHTDTTTVLLGSFASMIRVL